jgi:hypothetical protein
VGGLHEVKDGMRERRQGGVWWLVGRGKWGIFPNLVRKDYLYKSPRLGFKWVRLASNGLAQKY